jgi:hypothetical protein
LVKSKPAAKADLALALAVSAVRRDDMAKGKKLAPAKKLEKKQTLTVNRA